MSPKTLVESKQWRAVIVILFWVCVGRCVLTQVVDLGESFVSAVLPVAVAQEGQE